MKRRVAWGLLALLALALWLSPGPAPAVAEEATVSIRYEPNGAPGEPTTVSIPRTHLRVNTALGDLFSREGYTLFGWNTSPDGSGTAVGLGSRVDPGCRVLYAQWAAWTDESCFTVENGVLTAYAGSDDCVTVPASIRGDAIHAIGENAFAGCAARTVILPPSLKTIAFGAFRDAAVETLYLFDSIQGLSDYSFAGCESLSTLRLNAATPPVYAGTYYSTFADKYDRLLSLAGQQKLVLFSGSSARFGYDSAMLDAALPGYAVVNMGVFAYTNALPQLELIRGAMGTGDLLLMSPELDAAKRQFCTTRALDAPFFNLMEENYDMLSALDLREYTLVFSSLSEYLSVKSRMEGRGYDASPADFDEDGQPVSSPSYNPYGDYILYRPNAATDAPLYGLAVPYTAAYYRKEQYIDPLNAEIRRFTAGGIRVYLTYSPRNRLAVSEDSDEAAIRALDRYFRETLEAPVISDIFDSLVDGRYLWGTDNHLSTQGVQKRTRQIIRDLRAQLRLDGLSAEAGASGITDAQMKTAAFIAYALSFALLFAGAIVPRLRWLSSIGGFAWAAGTVLSLLGGASLGHILLMTLGLLLVAAYAGKGGARHEL